MLGGVGGGGDDVTDLLLQVVPWSNLECAVRTGVQHLQLEELGMGRKREGEREGRGRVWGEGRLRGEGRRRGEGWVRGEGRRRDGRVRGEGRRKEVGESITL